MFTFTRYIYIQTKLKKEKSTKIDVRHLSLHMWSRLCDVAARPPSLFTYQHVNRRCCLDAKLTTAVTYKTTSLKRSSGRRSLFGSEVERVTQSYIITRWRRRYSNVPSRNNNKLKFSPTCSWKQRSADQTNQWSFSLLVSLLPRLQTSQFFWLTSHKNHRWTISLVPQMNTWLTGKF